MTSLDINRRTLAVIALVVVSAMIGGGLLTTLLIGLDQDFFNSATDLTSFISAGASLLLVLVTTVYVIFTQMLVRETRNAREQEVMPVMKLDLESKLVGGLSPALKNIGNGPAIDIKGTLQLKPGGEEFEISSKNLAPGESTIYIQPVVPTETAGESTELVIDGEFTTVFGKRECFCDQYSLKLLSEASEFHPFTEGDRQLEHLSGIEDNLGLIANEIEGLENIITYRKRQIVVEALKREGSLTYQELAYETGLSLGELGKLLSYMKEFGLVDYTIETDSIIHAGNKNVLIKLPSPD